METKYKYCFNSIKSEKLKHERGFSFEEIIGYIEDRHLIDVIAHPNQDKYPNQEIYVIEIDAYIYLAPYYQTETEIILKTYFPSRKMTKFDLNNDEEESNHDKA